MTSSRVVHNNRTTLRSEQKYFVSSYCQRPQRTPVSWSRLVEELAMLFACVGSIARLRLPPTDRRRTTCSRSVFTHRLQSIARTRVCSAVKLRRKTNHS